MIRIKKWTTKRTKVSVTYEFDHDGKIYERTANLLIKSFPAITKNDMLPRIRGLAKRERAKLAKSSETVEEEE